MDIQLDMFEVQLGAGILLQFRTKTDVVRVLADAGVKAKGYSKDRVRSRLPDAFASFKDDKRRIDLIIGTHYDADHLDGLPPIIADNTFDIGEIWLPPVANDTDRHPSDVAPDDRNILALQLSADETGGVLHRYLAAKAEICDTIKKLEHEAARPGLEGRSDMPTKVLGLTEPRPTKDRWRAFFADHMAEASTMLGEGHRDHADETPREEFADPIATFEEYLIPAQEHLRHIWQGDQDLAHAHATSLAFIRHSTAKEAINALALDAVVAAAKARKLPIRCSPISDGLPRRFIWRQPSQRFEPNEQEATSGPELILLGPSQGLVKKHWDRLPIGSYLSMLAYSPLPLKGITPSNQLSYVCVFKFAGQKILICGDAGFVDFRPAPRSPFYPKLISALKELDVIQIAHHGGLNHSFYNGLLAAKDQERPRLSYLLLSHALHDKTRPSAIFGQYVAQIRDGTHDPLLLFTSEPLEALVRDFKPLIAPVVGKQDHVGDVRIAFIERAWSVISHAVQVP